MRTLKNILVILTLFLLIIEPVKSQNLNIDKEKLKRETITYPNILKMNTLALLFKKISLVYERRIIPKVSAGLGVGIKYAGTEPKLLSINHSDINIDIGKIHGYSITPEAKYYIRSCDPKQLDGLYLSLYLRYTNYETAANFDYLSKHYHANIGMSEFGVGFELGYQLIIRKRFSIDFLFLGPRFSNNHMTFEFKQPPSQRLLGDISDYMNKVITKFGFDYNIDIQKGRGNKAETSFISANTRFGISLGFVF